MYSVTHEPSGRSEEIEYSTKSKWPLLWRIQGKQRSVMNVEQVWGNWIWSHFVLFFLRCRFLCSIDSLHMDLLPVARRIICLSPVRPDKTYTAITLALVFGKVKHKRERRHVHVAASRARTHRRCAVFSLCLHPIPWGLGIGPPTFNYNLLQSLRTGRVRQKQVHPNQSML